MKRKLICRRGWNRLAATISCLVASVSQDEVHVGLGPEAMADHLDHQHVAFFRVENIPVAIALLSITAGDLAWHRHRLGLVRRVVVIVFDNDRRLGKASSTGLERRSGRQAIFEAVQSPIAA